MTPINVVQKDYFTLILNVDVEGKIERLGRGKNKIAN